MNNQDLEVKLNFITGIALAYIVEFLDSEYITPELVIMAKSFENDECLDQMNVEDEELPYKFFDYYMDIREALKTKGE